MRTGIVAFLAGVLLLLQFPRLPSAGWLWLLLPVLPLLFHAGWPRFPAWFVLGFLWCLLHATIIVGNDLPDKLAGETVMVTGQVVSMIEPRIPGVRFEFHVAQITHNGEQQATTPGKVRLTWYRDPPGIRPGERWQLAVRLKPARGFMNPGGFDYERWLFQQRLRATGYVVSNTGNKRLQMAGFFSVDAYRQVLRDNIAMVLGDDRFRGLITALGLGDRSTITSHQRDTLIKTGTSHLLAISGLHVGLIAGMVFFLVRRVWGLAGSIALSLSSPRAAAIAAIGAGFVYAILAGFAIPTQRALVMLAVVMWSIIGRQRYPFTQVMAIALLLVLLLDPLAVLSAGFWLSFGAIAVIAYGMLYRHDSRNPWWRWGRAQVLVAVGLLPLLLFWFQQAPIYGVLANLVAIPWVSLLVVPLTVVGTLLGCVSQTLSGALLELAALLLSCLWPFLEWLAGLESAAWHARAPDLPALLLALLGVTVLLMPRGLPGRWPGVIFLLPALLSETARPAQGELWFTLLDVGQGLAAVIQTRHHALVFDSGPRFSARFNAGDAVVVPFLRDRAISEVDRLIVSHADNDHIGGAPAVLSAFDPVTILTSHIDTSRLPGARLCRRGQHWRRDGVDFRVLHPGDRSYPDRNNRSCVLKITLADRSILLTGDIEREAERDLVRKYGDSLAATVLVVPHHGSATSSTPAFLDAVAPQLALIPAGYRNRFNLPSQAILRRYASRQIDMYNTAKHGAISIKLDSRRMSLSTYRQQARRFWHHGP